MLKNVGYEGGYGSTCAELGPLAHGGSPPDFCRFCPSIARPAVLKGIADIRPTVLNRRDVPILLKKSKNERASFFAEIRYRLGSQLQPP